MNSKSTIDSTVNHQKRTSYLVENPKFPFCKGCSHTNVMRKLNEALVELQLTPANVSIVTDIGCIGMADALFKDLHTVHTTHGRSTAFASGIALADSVLADSKLKTIVLIGDGGAMIGLQHLVHAAMLNVDVTVLICNNFVYGMTGGQGSGLTPECFVTATTPEGNIVPPVDICQILKNSNAPFVARGIATDQNLSNLIAKAISYPGFAAIEILELCTEFAVHQNELTGKKLTEVAKQNGWQLGMIKEGDERPTFAKRYFENQKESGTSREKKNGTRRLMPRNYIISNPVSILVAGSAGEKVQSASGGLCQAAIQSGLHVTQKNDNPVTQGSGFSLSEIWLSPEEIGYTGVEQPDILIITSMEGYAELEMRGIFQRLSRETKIFIDDSIGASLDALHVFRMPFRKTFGPMSASLAAIGIVAIHEKLVDDDTMISILKTRLKGESESVLNKIEEFARIDEKRVR